MTHATPSSFTFDPRAARAIMATLQAGLLVLVEWLLHQFGCERAMPRETRHEMRDTLRDARECLFGLLVETYAHRLAPTPPPQRRVHDHRPRRKVRSAVKSHRSAISLRRVLKRTLPKAGRTLRQRFISVFFILRRFERLLRRFRAMLAKNYTSAWRVTDIAARAVASRVAAPAARDSS